VPGRLDVVKVATSRGVVEISWSDRAELLERLEEISGSEDLVAAFKDAGTTRPVELNEESSARLRGVLGFWAKDVGGEHALPEGVRDLSAALE